MSDVNPDAVNWLERYTAAIGVAAPSTVEIEALLELAGVAAHTSHRQAAPVACWLAARAGLSPSEALNRANALAG